LIDYEISTVREVFAESYFALSVPRLMFLALRFSRRAFTTDTFSVTD